LSPFYWLLPLWLANFMPTAPAATDGIAAPQTEARTFVVTPATAPSAPTINSAKVEGPEGQVPLFPGLRPPPPPKPKPPASIGSFPAGFQTAQIIDGDTLRLVSRERVRLIGVNAPELKEKLGPMAAQCLKDILGGQRVRLEVGVEPKDRYGRMLAHVHTESGVYVNAELLRLGCAKLMVIGANVSHLFGLVKAQEEARKAQRGVWTP